MCIPYNFILVFSCKCCTINIKDKDDETQCEIRGRNSSRSTDMTGQILTLVRSEFSVIIEMTGHFFPSTTRKRDC